MATNVDKERLLRQMKDWPKSWQGIKSDLPIGVKIVEVLEPFVVELVRTGNASSTIIRHMANLWVLGAEIITRLHRDPELRELSGIQLLLRFVEEEGGPLSRHCTEEEQRSLDSTCRKVYRFLEEQMAEAKKVELPSRRRTLSEQARAAIIARMRWVSARRQGRTK